MPHGPAGAAVSAVVIYRLAAYWLPVLPGWLSWRLLRHLGYVRRGSARRTVLATGRDGMCRIGGTRRVRRMPVARDHHPFGLRVLKPGGRVSAVRQVAVPGMRRDAHRGVEDLFGQRPSVR